MSDPIFGTDPLDGSNFSFGQRLRSTPHMNDILPWLRNLDSALENAIARNWNYLCAGHANNDALACTFSPTTGKWITVGNTGGGAPAASSSYDGIQFTASAPGAGIALTGLDCVASRTTAGTIVAGGSAGATTDNYRTNTAGGGGAWAAGISSSAAAHDIRTICWTGLMFVAGSVASGGANIIEYNFTGLGLWTATAVPAACAAYSWIASASDGADCVVLVPSDVGATSFAVSSFTPPTFAAKTVPAGTWKAVAYAAQSGEWLAVGDATIVQSLDADSWAVGTATLPGTMTAAFGLASTGNLFVLAWGDGAAVYISVSNDWGATWRRVYKNGAIGTMAANSLAFGKTTDGGGRLCLCDAVQSYVSHRVEI